MPQTIQRATATKHQQPGEDIPAHIVEAGGIRPRISVGRADDLLRIFHAAQNRRGERIELAYCLIVELLERALIAASHRLDELHEFRMNVAGKTKAEQIQASGAQIVVSPCANCKKQLRELMNHYKLPVQVVGVHDLILRAIEF